MITSAPIEIVYDAVSHPDTQNATYNLLAPGGKLVLMLPSSLGDEHKDGKQVIMTVGSPFFPASREVSLGMYDNLNSYLQEELLQVRVRFILMT